MKLLNYIFPTLLFLLIFSCSNGPNQEFVGPRLTPEIIGDDTDPVKDSLKKVFFEELYYADEGLNVDSIRYGNWRDFYDKNPLKNNQTSLRVNESFANGYLTATWHERGPNNEAGDLREVDFLPETEEIYGISSVGHLFKGSLDGGSWTVLRDDIRFKEFILEVVPNNGANRIFAVYGSGIDNKVIRYSDDEGQTWNKGVGFSFYDHWGASRRLYTLSDDNVLYYLVQTWSGNPWGSVIQLYKSTDKGLSYNKVWQSSTGYGREDIDLWKPYDSDKMYMVDNVEMKFYEINHDFNTGEAQISTPVSYAGQNIQSGEIHVTGRFNNAINDYELFIYHGLTNEIYKTSNGANWTLLTSPSETVWRNGWMADPNNTNLYVGGFQLNKTSDYTNWNEQYSQWWWYYSQSKDFMHVDIMNLDYFEKSDGTPFILICNHGGLHVTYDSFGSTSNLGLNALNVVTLYDQTTSSDGYLYCGAQDKGTFMYLGNSKANFDVLSTQNRTTGDGMLGVFFNDDKSLFGMLQLGYLLCIPDKTDAAVTYYGGIPGNHTSGWINPMVATVDPTDNKAYVAGGNLNGGDGCYLIEVEIEFTFGVDWELSQFDYDFRANSNDGASVIKALGVSESDEDRIYVSTGDATFFYTEDRGLSWTKSSATLPSTMIPWEIITSDTNADRVFISGTGFSNAGVYQSNDGGDTFFPLSNSIPLATFYEVALSDDEDMLFAATSEGPFVYVFEDAKWYDLIGAITPYVNYTSVDNIGDNIIRFGTYGRGVWDLELDNEQVSTIEKDQKEQVIRLYPNPVSDYLNIELDLSTKGKVYGEILDMNGRLISRHALNAFEEELIRVDVSSLSAGMYLIQVVNGEEQYIEKFMKQ
jgi:hypothetical protein